VLVLEGARNDEPSLRTHSDWQKRLTQSGCLPPAWPFTRRREQRFGSRYIDAKITALLRARRFHRGLDIRQRRDIDVVGPYQNEIRVTVAVRSALSSNCSWPIFGLNGDIAQVLGVCLHAGPE
jgi:hypothetical protein